MVRPGHRGARQQQDQRVEERELERVERMDALGRPHAADREQARGEEGPEEGREEHHLGGDEQGHAVAQPELHDRRVEALEGRLADHVAPPHRHRRQHRDEADDHQRPAVAAMHVEHPAEGEHPGRDRADDRPRARIDEMVGVLRRPVPVASRHARARRRGGEMRSRACRSCPIRQIARFALSLPPRSRVAGGRARLRPRRRESGLRNIV